MTDNTELVVDGIRFRASVGANGDHNLVGIESLVRGNFNWWSKSSVEVLMLARWLEGVGAMIQIKEREHAARMERGGA